MRMGGKPTAFGFDEEQLPEAVRAVLDSAQLRLVGLHMFAGTQVLDPEVLASQWAHALDVTARVARETGSPSRTPT